ncbi:cytochrome P450 [Nocardioides sp. W7]|uniref:cytochrome P450 n=1 Tax=Nocardioides sp. W7 TaxID=2931390 RepID=UPI001FD49B42|nr:cytochrome P450 [Nocardioides sp. W7]
MAAAGGLIATTPSDGAEDSNGVLGAVLRAAGSPTPVRLSPDGPVLVTTPEGARAVLTSPDDYALPFDVTRQAIRRHSRAVKDTPPLAPDAVAAGAAVFATELSRIPLPTAPSPTIEVDTLALLRMPVALSTTAAMVPGAEPDARRHIATLALAWVDSLGPIISAIRPPRRWSKVRRAEGRARELLERALASAAVPDPPAVVTALAAGVQVPIAAGAWCLTQLASRDGLHDTIRQRGSLVLPMVWEVLRLYPPTWVLPRISTRAVTIDGTAIPAYCPVLVSPLALGLLPRLVPGPREGCSPLDELDPVRWQDSEQRPGAWLPFGAGPHACPGRNLGLAQLVHLVTWSTEVELTADAPPSIDTDRGLSPRPPIVRVRRLSGRA